MTDKQPSITAEWDGGEDMHPTQIILWVADNIAWINDETDFKGKRMAPHNYMFDNMPFHALNMSQMIMQGGTFTNCKFHNTNLAYAEFEYIMFRDVEFWGTDLSNASFTGCSFQNCSFNSIVINNKTTLNRCNIDIQQVNRWFVGAVVDGRIIPPPMPN